MLRNHWQIKSTKIGKENPQWLLQVLSYNRGLTTPQKLKDFLSPILEHILEVKLTDINKAVKRVEQALKNQEKIVVYSDYDADGICATAIMWETLHDLGADVIPYVPHRVKEGYGLSKPAITELADSGTKLIITVDHGVTAIEQVEHAKSLGVDVIITDHHVLPKNPPKPHALVHATEFCGAGVSWRFCWEVVRDLRPSYKQILMEKLDLAALATIADLVPVLGGSRAIVRLGLEELAKSKRPGIKALMTSAGINGSIGTYEIGHILAPRINAMGRIEHGLDSLRLLCTKSPPKAYELAQLLTKTNSKRQDLTVKAIEQAAVMTLDEHSPIGIFYHHQWHEGIIGLVAARLVEKYHKPMIVISKGEVYSKGSARSIPGFNIVEAIRSSTEYLVDGGGHPMAAGFTIETKYVEIFKERMNKYAQNKITDDILSPTLEIECQLEKADITKRTLEIINQFEPFGVGNPQPFFLTRGMIVEDIRCVGAENKHLKLQIDEISAIGFNMGEQRAQIRPGYLIDVVYQLSEDTYNGNNQVQMKIKDLALSH